MSGRSDPQLAPYTIYNMQKALVDQLTGETIESSGVDGFNTTLKR